MAFKEIKTQITINASKEKVWTILTNFENYPSWNPFIKKLTGDMIIGKNIRIELEDMSFKPELLIFKPNEELRWKGKFLFKGIFDGEHSFRIKENGDGTVTFFHEEVFNGILVSFLSKKLDTETKKGFIKMNDKLKELAEA